MATLILLVGRDLAAGTALRGEFGNGVVVGDDIASELNIVVGELSELGIVDTEDFGLLRAAEGKTWDEVHDEKDNAGSTEGVCETSNGVGKLVGKLNVVTVDPSTWNDSGAIEMSYVVRGKDTSQQVSDDSSNTVLSEDIEGVVNVDEELELGGVVACGSSDNTVDNSGPWWDVSRSWSDGDETSDDTGAETNSGPLLLKTVIEQAPGDSTDGSSNVGNQASHNSTDVGSTGRSTVESEPSNPEENGTEDNVGDVVWAVVEFVSAVSASLSKHERVSQSSRSRRNMDWSSSGEIETSHLVRPSVGVPGPAGKWVVDYGGPDEHEDDGWKHATTLSSGTNGECDTINHVSSKIFNAIDSN